MLSLFNLAIDHTQFRKGIWLDPGFDILRGPCGPRHHPKKESHCVFNHHSPMIGAPLNSADLGPCQKMQAFVEDATVTTQMELGMLCRVSDSTGGCDFKTGSRPIDLAINFGNTCLKFDHVDHARKLGPTFRMWVEHVDCHPDEQGAGSQAILSEFGHDGAPVFHRVQKDMSLLKPPQHAPKISRDMPPFQVDQPQTKWAGRTYVGATGSQWCCGTWPRTPDTPPKSLCGQCGQGGDA